MGDPKRKRRASERWDLEGKNIQSSAAGHVPRAALVSGLFDEDHLLPVMHLSIRWKTFLLYLTTDSGDG